MSVSTLVTPTWRLPIHGSRTSIQICMLVGSLFTNRSNLVYWLTADSWLAIWSPSPDILTCKYTPESNFLPPLDAWYIYIYMHMYSLPYIIEFLYLYWLKFAYYFSWCFHEMFCFRENCCEVGLFPKVDEIFSRLLRNVVQNFSVLLEIFLHFLFLQKSKGIYVTTVLFEFMITTKETDFFKLSL